MIRKVTLEDAGEISEIYNHYILNSIATFETIAIGVEEMQNRIRLVQQNFPWLVFESDGEILGYAYATEWRARRAYKRTVESTVYLRQDAFNKGIGTKLYKALLKELKKMKVHAVIGGISLPNDASVALHEKFKFEKVAHFKEVGFKFNKWIDVGYWELLFKD